MKTQKKIAMTFGGAVLAACVTFGGLAEANAATPTPAASATASTHDSATASTTTTKAIAAKQTATNAGPQSTAPTTSVPIPAFPGGAYNFQDFVQKLTPAQQTALLKDQESKLAQYQKLGLEPAVEKLTYNVTLLQKVLASEGYPFK